MKISEEKVNRYRAALHAERKGYTILELVIMLAVLIILGAAIIPSLAGYYGNTRQKEAADLIRSRIVEGRAKAMEQGVWYRLAVNQDKTRIRLAPDGPNFSSATPSDSSALNAQVTEDTLDKEVTAEVATDPNSMQSSGGGGSSSSSDNTLSNGAVASDGDWLTVMTVGPEGICKENATTVTVKQGKFEPILIQLRGIVGSADIILPGRGDGSKK